MKKVLLITYYFDPGNAVATPRIMSWANEFHQDGIELTVVTRHFKGDEWHWLDFIKETTEPIKVVKNERFSVHYLPYQSGKPALVNKNKLYSKFYHLKTFLQGNFNTEINAYKAFGGYCRELLRKNPQDLILVSAPPHNLVRLAGELGKEFDLPFVVDFRDIWNNLITGKNELSMRKSFSNFIEEKYIGKWLKEARLVTTVSQALVEQVKRIYNGKCIELTNGYEMKLFNQVNSTNPPSKRFIFASIGTIYPIQNISIMIEGLKIFYDKLRDKSQFEIKFIGLGAIESVAQYVKSELNYLKPIITQKLSRKEVFKHYIESHVLFIPAWSNHKGIYSTKIFEYIGSGRKILVAPGDNDVIDNIVRKSGRGYIANSAEEFASLLSEIYDLWQSGKYRAEQPAEWEQLFSREKQAELLANEILKIAK
ncbi:MAG TPA: hypothetical protein PLU85_10160 [Bacteroidia bacterium]|nr:hypothetical protein [Bacteroidia bacterium]QQR94573.1 MAG: hypothetical protein IPJ93_12260 [Bacteroidota bacterium]MBP7714146.1 hypothetical protein [Bacteroidia bacterium]HOZ82590.1 hypothetical protein [Bacteroidia bacterium]HOZ91350.1 hypothetical protein [Bacteroidia bacterium]